MYLEKCNPQKKGSQNTNLQPYLSFFLTPLLKLVKTPGRNGHFTKNFPVSDSGTVFTPLSI